MQHPTTARRRLILLPLPSSRPRRTPDRRRRLRLPCQGARGKVSHFPDYDYVEQLEKKEGILIRHTRQRDDVLAEDDMTAADRMLQQAWIVGTSRAGS